MEHATTAMLDGNTPPDPNMPPANGDYADQFLPHMTDYTPGTIMPLEGTVRDIVINVNDCDVKISNNSAPSIEYSEQVKYTLTDGVLTITSPNPGGYVNIGIANILGDCKITSNGGNIDIYSVTVNSLNIFQLDSRNNGLNITGSTVNRSASLNATGIGVVKVDGCTFGARANFDTTGVILNIYSSMFNAETSFTATAANLTLENCTLADTDFYSSSSDIGAVSTTLRGDMALVMRGGGGYFEFIGYPDYYDIGLAETTAPEFPGQQIAIQLPDPNIEYPTEVDVVEMPDGSVYEMSPVDDNISNYKITLDTIGVTADDLAITFRQP
jgi:hypothetical protein